MLRGEAIPCGCVILAKVYTSTSDLQQPPINDMKISREKEAWSETYTKEGRRNMIYMIMRNPNVECGNAV